MGSDITVTRGGSRSPEQPSGTPGVAEATFRPGCCPAGFALGQAVLPTEDLDLLRDDGRVWNYFRQLQKRMDTDRPV